MLAQLSLEWRTKQRKKYAHEKNSTTTSKLHYQAENLSNDVKSSWQVDHSFGILKKILSFEDGARKWQNSCAKKEIWDRVRPSTILRF